MGRRDSVPAQAIGTRSGPADGLFVLQLVDPQARAHTVHNGAAARPMGDKSTLPTNSVERLRLGEPVDSVELCSMPIGLMSSIEWEVGPNQRFT